MISQMEWSYWTRGHVDDEREFGLTRKLGVGIVWLKEKWLGTDEYAAIFSKEQLQHGQFDTILMDVDAHAGGENWQDKVKEILSKVEVPPSRIYVTGRGAHLYWDLDKPIEGAGRYKQAVTALVKRWGIGKLVDERVVGDVRRVARLPMSKNSKGGYCVRVSAENMDKVEMVCQALDEDTVLESLVGSTVPRKISIEIHQSAEAERKFGPTLGAKKLYSEADYPACIRNGINEIIQTGELNHSERLHVFGFLVANDEKDKAFQILKQYAGDFDAGISEYQLNYLERAHFKMFKCINVPRHLCPFVEQRDCPYYPSINVHREQLIKAKTI